MRAITKRVVMGTAPVLMFGAMGADTPASGPATVRQSDTQASTQATTQPAMTAATHPQPVVPPPVMHGGGFGGARG
jgi:hypothetical protein